MTAPRAATQYREPKHARAYDADRFGGRFGRFLEARETALYLALLEGHEGPVLDAGAGTGKLTIPLACAGWRVVAADFSLPMLAIAQEKARRAALPGAFVVADAHALGFRDRAFACTVASRLLMHLPDWRAALGELCRVTRDVLVVDFPPSRSLARIESAWRRRVRARSGGAHRAYATISPAELARELARHGFTIERRHRGFFLPVRVHRLLDRPPVSLRIEELFDRAGLTARLGSPVTIKARRRR
ncbi:MAG TPA: methyltransferase domain-containing protein [Longimicrobiales bacterium]